MTRPLSGCGYDRTQIGSLSLSDPIAETLRLIRLPLAMLLKWRNLKSGTLELALWHNRPAPLEAHSDPSA